MLTTALIIALSWSARGDWSSSVLKKDWGRDDVAGAAGAPLIVLGVPDTCEVLLVLSQLQNNPFVHSCRSSESQGALHCKIVLSAIARHVQYYTCVQNLARWHVTIDNMEICCWVAPSPVSMHQRLDPAACRSAPSQGGLCLGQPGAVRPLLLQGK